MRKLFALFVTIMLVCSFSFLYHTNNLKQTQAKPQDGQDRNSNNNYQNTNPIFIHDPITLQGPRQEGGFSIGPEIPIPSLSGYYDYQMNGSQSHHLYRYDGSHMYAVYMTSYDSSNYAATRYSYIAWSADDGNTWQDLGAYPPTQKTGYPSVTAESNGIEVFGNHYNLGSAAVGYINYDAAPGLGSFNGVAMTQSAGWPQVARLTNGNILEVGSSFPAGSSGSTDTIVAAVFNTTSNTFSNSSGLISPAGVVGQNNMSLGSITGANGMAAILVNPYRASSNLFNLSIYSVLSTNNGVSWGTFNTLFTGHIIEGDSIAPNVNGACDVILDAIGNYYWAFNSLGPSGFFADGRLLVGRGTSILQIIAGTSSCGINPIPQIASTMAAQAFIANFDHPCFALSDDGQYIFITYSVPFQNDTLNGFNKCHIFYQYAQTTTGTDTMVWSAPMLVTDSGAASFDERYCSINRVALNQSGYYSLYLVYQKKRQPGSFATDNAPECRASLIFRKITDATLIGIKNNQQTAYIYKLGQNYPNPFNPQTTIQYSISHREFVTLKVYDILGNEVTTLVNGVQDAGSREVIFDASRFASGIYFYTLTAGNFRDTKKLTLIK